MPKNIDFILVGSKKILQNTFTNLKNLGLQNLANPDNLHIVDLKITSSDNESKSSYGNSSFYYLSESN